MTDVEKSLTEERGVQKTCPWWAESIPVVALIVADLLLCMYYIDLNRVVWRYNTFSYIFGGLCLVWFIFMISDRSYFGGIGGFYDAYWYCNIALILTSLGVLFGLPSLIGQSMCLILMPHLSFWVDMLCYPCLKKCVIGAFPWMFVDSTSWHEKLTSYHHFWFFPGITFVLLGQHPIKFESFILSIFLFLILIILARYMTPLEYVNPDGSKRFVNVCQAHQYPSFAQSIPPFKWSVGKPFYIYVITILCAYVIPVNLISYYLVVGAQILINKLV